MVIRKGSLAVELIDELTGARLVGSSLVSAFRLAAPTERLRSVSFLACDTVWVFEDLPSDEEAVIVIDAEAYFSETIQTGAAAHTLADPAGTVTVPSLTQPSNDAKFVRIRLRPRSGYPFPASLTRVVGSVLLDGVPVADADVSVTSRYEIDGGTVAGTDFHTRTATDGQFVAWLFPDTDQEHPAPIAFDVVATSGSSTGRLTDQPLISRTINGVRILMP